MKTKITIELPAMFAKFLEEDSRANNATRTGWICRSIALARRARKGQVTINGEKVVLL